ncbi:MAG TPA: hypothetical protein VHI52_08435, partial [Verrucomicrobiae bacterium]|nr:hypothetical protein [Verrucomicrobiae bacterium]
ALAGLMTDEGYLVKSIDPDGTRHGVFGASKHGYFEASPNHDAICFGVVGDEQARKIYRKMASIAGLRPHDLIIANYPSLDDMYEEPRGLWAFGTWVNGGHWTTCEARAIMAYYRVGAYEDARRSMKQILTFARRFRMDNPLVDFGNAVYQPTQPVNLTYDAFGAPAALIRGLFEYHYTSEGLRLQVQIPAGIDWLQQRFPIRFGAKRLYLAATGRGPITRVLVNGAAWTSFTTNSVFLPYASTPNLAAIEILRGKAASKGFHAPSGDGSIPLLALPAEWPQLTKPADAPSPESASKLGPVVSGQVLLQRLARFRRFDKALRHAGYRDSYEAAHARLALNCLLAAHGRLGRLKTGELTPLPAPSEAAADQLYLSTTAKLCDGLETFLETQRGSVDPRKRRVYSLWESSR